MIDGETGKIMGCQVSYKGLVRARRLLPIRKARYAQSEKSTVTDTTARPH